MRFSTSNRIDGHPTAQDDKFGPFGVARAIHCHYFGYTQHKSEPPRFAKVLRSIYNTTGRSWSEGGEESLGCDREILRFSRMEQYN